jgi:hypothetical protein
MIKSCIGCGFGTRSKTGYCVQCTSAYRNAQHTLVNRDILVNLAIDTDDKEWFMELSKIVIVGEL